MTSVASSCGSDGCLSLVSEGTCVDAADVFIERTLSQSSLAHSGSRSLESSPLFTEGCSPVYETLFDQRSCSNETRAPHGSLPEQLLNQFRQQMQLEANYASQQQQAGHAPDAGVRMIVVSWMVEVAEEFRLQQETLHMAVLLLDRFMGNSEDVPRCVLQLLAIGCVLLASKELEVSHPTVEQLCAVTANRFQPHDLLRMERIILNMLDFGLSGPSCYTFLHLLAQVCSNCVSPAVLSLAMYLCELAMLDAYTLSFSYSNKAAAALLLAQVSLGSPQHTPMMQAAVSACTGTDSLQGLGPCMAALLRLQQIAYQHTLAAAAASAAAAAAAAPAGLFGPAHMDIMACSPAASSAQSGGGAMASAGTAVGMTMQAPVPAAQPDDLLAPLRVKFGADCWCGVSTLTPMALLPSQV